MKKYEVCGQCGKIVQVNKFLFGSLHVCSPDGDSVETSQLRRNLYFTNKSYLEKIKIQSSGVK